MGSAEAQRSFPQQNQRLAFCESTYDRRGRANHFASIAIETATCAARRVTYMGRSFRVVPAVLVRSQVLRNNLGTTFLPAEEITDEWAAQWNNIPVLVGAHPGVSGRTPQTTNERCVGWIFNARAETTADGTRRLVGEVYLDEARAEAVVGFKAVLARLDDGQPVELSTGFATQTDENQGFHNGERYEMVLHPVGADHLVISTEMTGACSIQHGCGLGANEEVQVDEKQTDNRLETVSEPAVSGIASDLKKAKKRLKELDAILSDAAISFSDREQAQIERSQLMQLPGVAEALAGNAPTKSVDGADHPAGDFAYVPDPSKPSTWKLPIFDANHVRAALASLGGSHGNPPDIPAAAMAGVKRKIKAAASRFNVDAASLNTSPLKALLGKLVEMFGKGSVETVEMTAEVHDALRVKRAIAEMQLTPSDSERAQMLREACQEEYGASDRDVIVTDVYTQPEQSVIFFFSTPMGPQPKGAEYYKVMWVDADNDGIPELKGDPVLVRKQVTYEPVGSGPAGDGSEPAGNESPAKEVATPAVQSHNKEEGNMSDKEKETGLGELTAAVANLTKLVEAQNAKIESLEKQSAPAEIAGLKRTVGQLAESFEQMKGVTKAAIEERERERQHLVRELAGNHRCSFGAEELEAMPIDQLRKLGAMAQVANYTGRGGPQGALNTEEGKRFAEPKAYWETEGKKEGK